MSSEVQILLVEDDPADVELILNSLQRNGLANHVHVAGDGVEALDFMFGRGPHAGRGSGDVPKLVLLDLKLPRASGHEVLRAIKDDARTKLTPVVILTSSKEDEDRLKGYGLGANSYLQKPIEFEAFRETIRQLGLYWMIMNVPPPKHPVAG